jgi:hypothetical protein
MDVAQSHRTKKTCSVLLFRTVLLMGCSTTQQFKRSLQQHPRPVKTISDRSDLAIDRRTPLQAKRSLTGHTCCNIVTRSHTTPAMSR